MTIKEVTHRVLPEYILCDRPLAIDLPCGLRGEGGEREPVEVLVLFEVRECDHEEAIEHLGRLVVDDALPDLVCDPVEERVLVRILEVLDCVKVLERARRGHGVMWDSSRRAKLGACCAKLRKAHSLGITGERVASDGHVAAERDLLACFAVFDGAPGAIGGGNWKGIFGEAEDVDLEIGESVQCTRRRAGRGTGRVRAAR